MQLFGSALLLMVVASACNNAKEGRFLNLSTGKEVTVTKDEETGMMVDKETNKPVLLYADTRAKDTFYGVTGAKVNGKLERVGKGVYVYDDGEKKIKIDGDEYKVKEGDAKLKMDADGDEYKYQNGAAKINNEDGEYKEKGKGYAKKVDEDGDVKVETKNKKIKVDGETGEKKVKERSVFGKVKDKIKDKVSD